MDGHRLKADIVNRDLNRLLSVFMLMKRFADLLNEEYASQKDKDPLSRLHTGFTEDEIVHLLISTAIYNRTQLDHLQEMHDDPEEITFEPVEGSCGTLYPNIDDADSKELNLRDACNKIIHAKRIYIDESKKMNLFVHGTYKSKKWKAILDIPNYVRLSFLNFDIDLP